MARGSGEEVRSEVLATFSDEIKNGRGTRIRSVDWISGDKHYPQVEKREFFTDEATGQEKIGKAKGFNAQALLVLIKNWPAICQHLNIDKAFFEKVFIDAKGATATATSTAAATPVKEHPEDF